MSRVGTLPLLPHAPLTGCGDAGRVRVIDPDAENHRVQRITLRDDAAP